ncbi:hypothetical protein OIE67_51890 [Nonomuraea fuscirosea]|jgi:hypothetical protein|uniref:hypothetical protein n=1 Tax=Nonomuraea fuscirosea TaxID=1291556 RepID=UPI002DD8FDF3|nr:hypothetical protein [Nonomuraea fuscirosea]WSA52430.1 hypothetical protein OIE67_51890 [Nonomuraea fuscirosea]
MMLRFLGKDPDSPSGGSPTLWQDQDTGDLIVQGYTLTDPVAVAEVGDIPSGEAVVRIPLRMLQFLPEAEQ